MSRPRAELLALTDPELMQELGRGNDSAFRVLVERHHRRVWALCLRLAGGDRAAADDLTQEVFFKVARAHATWTPEAPFTAWLFTIARNTCRDHLDKQARRPGDRASATEPAEDTHADVEAGDAARAAGPEHETTLRRAREALHAGLLTLPPEQREVVYLREIGGLYTHEVAAVQGVNENTVKSRRAAALVRLRDYLKGRGLDLEALFG